MREVICLLLLAPVGRAAEFAVAVPGYDYRFPRDHFAHPEFKTEWWYWTGNLRDSSGHRFGFELTFFRQALTPEPKSNNPWDLRDLYLAHFTVSDVDGRRFHRFERLNRAGPGLAGADETKGRIWNGNWQAGLDSLSAVAGSVQLQLNLRPKKPPVIHGTNGVSQKATGPGRASHYISLSRIDAEGVLEIHGRKHILAGTAWMDHEFFTHQLEPDQVGWDWMSIQLGNDTELMVFRLRRRDGTLDPHSSGTYIDRDGKASHLRAQDFTIEPVPGSEWRSPATGGAYPLRWRILVPSLGLSLEASTRLEDQEVVGKGGTSPTYWEGAMEYSGTLNGTRVRGVGYLEMTGYDRPVHLGTP